MTKFASLFAAAGLALLASASHAQVQVNPQGPLDADGDGFLTEQEFQPIRDFGANFVAYDSDGDGLLSEAEYNEGVRDLADTEQDNDLTDIELQRYDELARMFSNELSDRDNLLNFFQPRGVDETATGSIVIEDAADDAN